MYSITGTSITLTKGDTFVSLVTLKNRDGTAWTPNEGDEVRFALKRNVLNAAGYIDTEPLIEKTIPTDTMILRIDSADTKTLLLGDYAYDIEVTFADSTVDTPINNARLTLVPEVD